MRLELSRLPSLIQQFATPFGVETEGLKPSPNLCKNCQEHNNDVYELQDPDELTDLFTYGEWLDEDTFAVNLHPNCVCLIVRDHDVYW